MSRGPFAVADADADDDADIYISILFRRTSSVIYVCTVNLHPIDVGPERVLERLKGYQKIFYAYIINTWCGAGVSVPKRKCGPKNSSNSIPWALFVVSWH